MISRRPPNQLDKFLYYKNKDLQKRGHIKENF